MTLIDTRGRPAYDSEAREFRRQVERGELERVRPGVFAAPSDTQPSERHRRLVVATAPVLDDDSVISHASAAVLHGLPVLAKRLDRVTVLRPRSNGQRTRHLHARRAEVPHGDRVDIDGLTTTSLARTVIDLARVLPFGEGLAVADAALRLGVHPDALTTHGRGSSRVARVAHHASPLAESIGESLSRAAFLDAGLPAPRLQVEFHDASGLFVARTDFFWEAARVIGEFDGLAKYASGRLQGTPASEHVRREKEREGRLRDLGFDVVRWTWSELQEGNRVTRRVQLALQRGGA